MADLHLNTSFVRKDVSRLQHHGVGKKTQHLYLCLLTDDNDQKQYSLFMVVNCGTINLASGVGADELVKQKNFTKISKTKLVKCMKSWNMIGFVIFTCQIFHHIVSGLFSFYFVVFPSYSLSEGWGCTFSRGHFDGPLFDHQRLWALLMAHIRSWSLKWCLF